MENTILELVEICRQKELFCMHDNVDDLIESALNFKLLSINSQRLNKEKQEVKNVVEQPAECRNRIIESLQNFRVIHKNSTSLKNTSQISPVHAIAPILSTKEPKNSPSMGYENPNTTSETKSDEIIKSGVKELVPILSENKVTSEDKEYDVPVCENSPIYIEYVEASLPDQEIVSVKEENVVYHEEEEEGDIRFLEELLIDDSIPFPNNELSDSDFDNPSIPGPPPEPPDDEFDFEPDSEEEILVMMNTNDELECLEPRDEFDDNDYYSFMFVIYSKVFSFPLSAENEDTIVDPGIFV
uniref:Reverse transcriptase domain-containing protein n=1 Tax=Tanacetum cinerariifolium TaxID=118510 RepID=A0A6L2N7D5_TANCI|nr:hypothetical protein [Tanacetum cinerariifolium]